MIVGTLTGQAIVTGRISIHFKIDKNQYDSLNAQYDCLATRSNLRRWKGDGPTYIGQFGEQRNNCNNYYVRFDFEKYEYNCDFEDFEKKEVVVGYKMKAYRIGRNSGYHIRMTDIRMNKNKKQIYMPVHRGRDSKGNFYQWGNRKNIITAVLRVG